MQHLVMLPIVNQTVHASCEFKFGQMLQFNFIERVRSPTCCAAPPEGPGEVSGTCTVRPSAGVTKGNNSSCQHIYNMQIDQ